jgi:hypothetical protein
VHCIKKKKHCNLVGHSSTRNSSNIRHSTVFTIFFSSIIIWRLFYVNGQGIMETVVKYWIRATPSTFTRDSWMSMTRLIIVGPAASARKAASSMSPQC